MSTGQDEFNTPDELVTALTAGLRAQDAPRVKLLMAAAKKKGETWEDLAQVATELHEAFKQNRPAQIHASTRDFSLSSRGASSWNWLSVATGMIVGIVAFAVFVNLNGWFDAASVAKETNSATALMKVEVKKVRDATIELKASAATQQQITDGLVQVTNMVAEDGTLTKLVDTINHAGHLIARLDAASKKYQTIAKLVENRAPTMMYVKSGDDRRKAVNARFDGRGFGIICEVKDSKLISYEFAIDQYGRYHEKQLNLTAKGGEMQELGSLWPLGEAWNDGGGLPGPWSEPKKASLENPSSKKASSSKRSKPK